MKKSKALLLALCAAALSVGVTFGTLAYLTDTEAVTNTFTVGQVHISLDEADVNPDGTYETNKDDRVTKNEYHLIPGHTYIKDPTVHVRTDSEDCWVFVKVENGLGGNNGIESSEIADDSATAEDESYSPIAKQIATNGWTLLDGNVYYKKWIQGDPVDLKVFDEFKIAGETTNAEILEYKTVFDDTTGNLKSGEIIKVTAYAIQAAGFDNANLAWGAYAAQHPNP